MVLLTPPPRLLGAAVKRSTKRPGYTPTEVLRSPVFYLLYLMFVLIAAGGLSMTAAVKPMAADLKVDKMPVDLFGVVLAAGMFALSLSRIFDGVGRPFFGWLSDKIGREYTMALAFFVGAGALFTLNQSGLKSGAVRARDRVVLRRVRGDFQSVPATQGDTFGSKFAAANNGMLYTAKGAGALLVPAARGSRRRTAMARCSRSSSRSMSSRRCSRFSSETDAREHLRNTRDARLGRPPGRRALR